MSTTRVHLAGTAGIPVVGASVAVVTVTVASAVVGGHLTVFADGTSRPGTSNVNFTAGQTVADQVYAPLGTDGSIAVYNDSRGSAQLIVDVSGYFATQDGQPAGGFVSLPAARVVDTRSGLGGHVIPARSTLHWSVLGHGPIPASGVSAIAFTLTAVTPSARGYLTAYTNDGGKPPTSNVDFAARQTVANLAVIAVGADGDIAFYNGSSGPTQVVVDVLGYFTSGTPIVAGAYVPIGPTRSLSDKAESAGTDFPAPETTLETEDVEDPSTALLNVTVSSPTSNGYVTVFPPGTNRPITSNLNFTAGNSSAGMALAQTNLLVRPLIHNGSSGPAHFSVDQFGYYIGAPDPGSISGTARDSGTSTAVPGVRVVAYQSDPDGDDNDWFEYSATTTAADGTYTMSGLIVGQQYWICFDTRSTPGTGAFTGYASQCYDHVAWSTPAYFDDDPGATLFSVSAGSSITGIDASLAPVQVGGIAGTVTAVTGSAIAGVSVTVTGTNRGFVITTQTDSVGGYTAPILPEGDYTVCFHATTAPSPAVPYGYLDRCEPIEVADGAVARADATLVAGGGISGKVTTASGALIHFGDVEVFAMFGAHASAGSDLNVDGSYTVGGLAPGPYAVCFDGGNFDLNPPYGYVDECYRDVVWAGQRGAGPPAGTTAVTVTAATTHSGINATLASNGAISGTVTDTAGARLSSIEVDVFDDSTGHPIALGGGGVDADGTYTEIGLAPSAQYIVCFKGDEPSNPPAQAYTSQCWHSVPWNGDLTAVPNSATRIVVTSGATTTGINATLTRQ